MADLPIRCACGALRGVARGVSADAGNRGVCYCDDCQSFAHALKRADAVLDAHGGTDIFQMSVAKLAFTDGVENLACLRLTPNGLMRWYASCCDTPIGNTLARPGVPFVGLLVHAVDPNFDAAAREAALGPVRAGVHARFAKGGRGALDAHDRAPLSMIFRFVGVVLRARLRGDQKRSPFFDAAGRPRVEPRVLSADELCAVEAERDRDAA